jgi:hypothetical protein
MGAFCFNKASAISADHRFRSNDSANLKRLGKCKSGAANCSSYRDTLATLLIVLGFVLDRLLKNQPLY